jgi:hypothetical protein
MPKTISNQNITLFVSVDEYGKIAGSAAFKKNDFQALSFRENNKAINTDSYLEKLENTLNGIQISDYKIDNLSNLENQL